MQELPIDPLLPEAISALRHSTGLVLTAAPGAGKTTRLPRALLLAGIVHDQEILVLEPRRIAARLAARRVAEELGERVGERVGYQVRFEEVASPATRLRFVTEGLLARRLLSDRALCGVGTVVLDELHERNLHTDLALALLRRLQTGLRPDLRLVAMSATLDAGPVAAFLGGCPHLASEGRQFEVRLEWNPLPDPRPLEVQVVAALGRLLAAGLQGDALVFLPGASEIRRAAQACAPLADAEGLVVLPLHGSLSSEEQDRAVRPLDRRKLILATNVAETSITIDGVVAVIDSGLARLAGHSAFSGLPTLRIAKISRASAAQRAGRAGRTRPGVCLRLYTRHDHDGRLAYEPPEILRSDLCEALLTLHALGVANPKDLPWLEAPPAEPVEAAEDLLRSLGATEDGGRLTALGRRLSAFPLHPRLARIAIEGERRGVAQEACTLVALLGERDVTLRQRPGLGRRDDDRGGLSDPLELFEAFERARAARFDPDRTRALGLDPFAASRVDRGRRQLARHCGRSEGALSPVELESRLRFALLAGFPDRVGRRRRPGQPDLLLMGGGAATLSPESVVRRATLLVAVEAEELQRLGQPTSGFVRSASAIEAEWLLDLFPDGLREEKVVAWNSEGERVEALSKLCYGAVTLEEGRAGAGDPVRIAEVLAEAALTRGPRAFASPEGIDRLLGRIAAAASWHPEAAIPLMGETELRLALIDLCQGRHSFAELREASLAEALRGRLASEQRRLLSEVAPEAVALPSGRRTEVQYAVGRPPWIEARLQDLFGLRVGPAVDRGRVPLILHLLAPNRRAVQVTSDLAGFWERTYPTVRRELSRRYPRHAWPEDPLQPSARH